MRLEPPNPVILTFMLVLGVVLHLTTGWPPLIGWSIGCVLGASIEFGGMDY